MSITITLICLLIFICQCFAFRSAHKAVYGEKHKRRPPADRELTRQLELAVGITPLDPEPELITHNAMVQRDIDAIDAKHRNNHIMTQYPSDIRYY